MGFVKRRSKRAPATVPALVAAAFKCTLSAVLLTSLVCFGVAEVSDRDDLTQTVGADALARAPSDPPSMADIPDLVKTHCVHCHANITGGGGRLLHTRTDSLVSDFQDLVQRVNFCQQGLGLNWSGQTIHLTASYLNEEYYHFPR